MLAVRITFDSAAALCCFVLLQAFVSLSLRREASDKLLQSRPIKPEVRIYEFELTGNLLNRLCS